MTTMLYILIAVTALWQGVHAFEWNETAMVNESTIYVCKGNNITLGWQHVLHDPSEVLRDIHWRFNNGSMVLVALYAFGYWAPVKPYIDRVTRLGDDGITITNATVEDSGNYSVEIQMMKAGRKNFSFQRMIVVVRVFDHLLTTDGKLYVSRGLDAILDPSTNRYAVPLTCGKFVFGNNPPYDVPQFPVEWLINEREDDLRESSDFVEHQYRLFIHGDGEENSNYMCRIPERFHHTTACYDPYGGTESGNLTVNMMAIRLSLLEKELKDKLFMANATLWDRLERLIAVRLVNGTNATNGRLEMFDNGIGNSVCDDSFNVNAAKVVCRRLGLPYQNASVAPPELFGQGTGNIILDDVVCVGNERSLMECSHPALYVNNCGHSEDVGIFCA